jgi:hypothetical protein
MLIPRAYFKATGFSSDRESEEEALKKLLDRGIPIMKCTSYQLSEFFGMLSLEESCAINRGRKTGDSIFEEKVEKLKAILAKKLAEKSADTVNLRKLKQDDWEQIALQWPYRFHHRSPTQGVEQIRFY